MRQPEKILTTKADAGGRGRVVLAKLDAGRPLEMTVKGSSGNTVTIKDILVGEVWVCSGQSNMQMDVNSCKDAKRAIAAATYPNIRLFTVGREKAATPKTDCAGQWVEVQSSHGARLLGGGRTSLAASCTWNSRCRWA